jgi:SAM-dependent methyltransferase
MNDYRRKLYSQYVSALKQFQIHDAERHRAYQFRRYAYNFLPIIAGLNRDDPVLELGCGPGYFLEFLKTLGYKNVVGIDISREQLQLAREKGHRAFYADAFRFLKSKHDSYSLILAVDLVEHFEKSELMRLFPMIFRSLRKGGMLAIQTPNGGGLFPGEIVYGDLTHLTIFTENSLRQILTLFGFGDIHFKEADPIADTVGGRIRRLLWRMVKLVVRMIRQIEVRSAPNLLTENMICWSVKP